MQQKPVRQTTLLYDPQLAPAPKGAKVLPQGISAVRLSLYADNEDRHALCVSRIRLVFFIISQFSLLYREEIEKCETFTLN